MNKRKLHHLHGRLSRFSPWLLLGAALVALCIGLVSLRQNNLTALRLRDEVLETDRQNGDVEAALRELREYVHGHMNTDLGSGPTAIRPPVQLKYRYERLAKAEEERVATQQEKIYQQAQADCERRFPEGLSGRNRIPCIEEYVSARQVERKDIPEDLYKFDFASPRWSLDTAGISLMIAALFMLLFVVRIGLERWFRNKLED
jgi:hypothetical protein